MKTNLRTVLIATFIFSILSSCNQKKETSFVKKDVPYTIKRESTLYAFKAGSENGIKNHSRLNGAIKGKIKTPIFLPEKYIKLQKYSWNDSTTVSKVINNKPSIEQTIISENTLVIGDFIELEEVDKQLVSYIVSSKTHSNITKTNTENNSEIYNVEGTYSDTITINIPNTLTDKNAQLLLAKYVYFDQTQKQINQEIRKINNRIKE